MCDDVSPSAKMSSPSPSSDLDDVFDAMEQPSPVRPCKRPHTMINSDNLDGDDEDTGPTPPDVVSASGTANPNVAAAVMRFLDRKHLHGHQKTDVQQFLNVSYFFLPYFLPLTSISGSSFRARREELRPSASHRELDRQDHRGHSAVGPVC
jgi:hypothetical protein